MAEYREKFRDFCDKNRSMNGLKPAFLIFCHFAVTFSFYILATCRAAPDGVFRFMP